MLKPFVSSQTKVCRVKQQRERESLTRLFQQMVCFPIWFVIRSITLQRTLSCCVRVLSFIDNKAQLRYFGNPNAIVPVVILLIVVETSPISPFLQSRRSTTTMATVTTLHHLKRWCSVRVFVGPDRRTQKAAIIGLSNSQKSKMKPGL